MPGGGRTPSAPAAASFRGTLRLVVRGFGDAVFVNQFNGSARNGYSTISNGGFTPDAPGVAVLGNIGLDVFARDAAGRIFVSRITT